MLRRYVIFRRKYEPKHNRHKRGSCPLRHIYRSLRHFRGDGMRVGPHPKYVSEQINTILTEKSFKRLAQVEAAEHINQTELCDWTCDCRSLKC